MGNPLTQEDYNSMMRDPGWRNLSQRNDVPVCPRCGERYMGDGVNVCVECATATSGEEE